MSDTDIDNDKFVDIAISGYTPSGKKIQNETNSSDEDEYDYVARKEATLKVHQKDVYSDDEDDEQKEFDLHQQYVYERGLDRPHKKNTHTFQVCIDSSNREINPITTESNAAKLENNPLKIVGNAIQITTGKNHTYSIDDQIVLRDVMYTRKSVKIYSSYVSGGLITRKYAIDIVRSFDDSKKSFMRFDVDPNIDVDTINALASTGFSKSKALFLGSTEDNLKYKEYDLSFTDMYVTISGFRTDDGSTEIGGIPLNFINKKHRMYLAPRELTQGSSPYTLGSRIMGITDTTTHSDNATKKSFYIKLPKEYSGTELTPSKYNVDIVFHHYGGIPVNEINAFYPISHNNANGYHSVSTVYTTKIEYKLSRNGYFVDKFGGSAVSLAKLDNVVRGNTDPNNYVIMLNKIYNNVIGAKVVSSTFPNTIKGIRDSKSSEPTNNRLYWNNADESKLYYIEIPEGNYTASGLKSKIEELCYNTLRQNRPVSTDSDFTLNQYITVDIDTQTDLVTFKSHKEAKLIKPIRKIDPNIVPTETFDGKLYDGNFILTINFNNHGLDNGDKIIISNAITTLGIPSASINGTHTVTEVLTDSSFTITLTGVNLEDVRRDVRGGNGIIIHTPNQFSLRFDQDDTTGSALGFRNVGHSTSVTPYSSTITNDDSYESELEIDPSGNKIQIRRNKINLSGAEYILISCDELNGMNNQGEIEEVFAKINTCEEGDIFFDTHIPTQITYREPIKELDRLTLKYYRPDGELVDFNNTNHSFVVELTTIDKAPEGTGIVPGLGNI